MSVLTTPRIVWKGLAWWNPGTGNNVKTELYDRELAGLSDPETIDPAAFHRRLIEVDGPRIRCGPNLYGDHGCGFVPGETRVVGGTLAPGHPCGDRDPVLGAAVRILGHDGGDCRIADIDPYAGWSSRIYLDRLEIGTQGNHFLSIGGARPTVFLHYDYARNYNASADLDAAGTGGALWQTTFSKSELLSLESGSSPLLASLASAMEADRVLGLMLRFYTYRAEYYQNGVHPSLAPAAPAPRNPRQLGELYSEGRVFANPAVSLVVGAIGLWLEGEMATVPGGRYLRAVEAVRPRNLLDDSPAGPARLGPLRVEADAENGVLALDTLATFPEWDSSGRKADFGELVLEVHAADGRRRELARLEGADYGRNAYETSGGIIDLPLAADALEDLRAGALALVAEQPGYTALEPRRRLVALAEERLVAEADPRGVYLDAGESRSVAVRVFDRGEVVGKGIRLMVAEYESHHRPWRWTLMTPPGGQAEDPFPLTGGGAAALVRSLLGGANPPDQPREKPGRVELSPARCVEVVDGTATFEMVASRPGCFNLLLLPFRAGDPVPVLPRTIDAAAMLQLIRYAHFVTGRVLPFDEDLPAGELTDEYVVSRLLRPCLLLSPGLIPDLQRRADPGGPDEARRLWQAIVEAATRPLEDTRYVPVTRDLSSGRREALARCWRAPHASDLRSRAAGHTILT